MLLLLTYSHRSLAVPTLYPQQSPPLIRNNTNSSVVMDSVHSNMAYVLPPRTAVAKAHSLSQVTSNLGFCAELADIQNYNRETLQLLHDLQKRQLRLEQAEAEKDSQLRLANAELEQLVVDFNLQDLQDVENDIQRIEKQLLDLYDRNRQCRQLCNVILEDIRTTQVRRSRLYEQRDQLRRLYNAKLKEYDGKKQKIQYYESEKNQTTQHLQEIRNILSASYRDYIAMYDVHAKREGAKAQIDYRSEWSDNLIRLKTDNPNLNFSTMPTQNAFIKADAYSKVNILPSASLINFEISGQQANAVMNLPSFPESFSSQATLNLMAACPYFFPELFGFQRGHPAVDPQKMKFALMVGYEYPSEFRYSLEVKYNAYRMFEITKKQGKSGGLFSTKSWSDHAEAETYRDAFTVNWSSDHTALQLSEDKKRALESDLRKQILTRVARTLLFKDEAKLLPQEALQAPNSGAVILANSLSSTCPFVMNCKAVSMGLNFLAGVFGSSETSQHLKLELDVEAVETYKTQQVVMQPGLTAFN